MSKQEFNTLTEVVSRSVHSKDCPLKVSVIAEMLNKSHTALSRELKAEDDGAKLGCDLLYPIMKITGDISPLEWLAEKMGYSLTKIEAEPDKGTWEAEHVQDMSAVGEMSKMMDSGAEPYAVFQQAEKAKKELDETVKKYFQFYNESIVK